MVFHPFKNPGTSFSSSSFHRSDTGVPKSSFWHRVRKPACGRPRTSRQGSHLVLRASATPPCSIRMGSPKRNIREHAAKSLPPSECQSCFGGFRSQRWAGWVCSCQCAHPGREGLWGSALFWHSLCCEAASLMEAASRLSGAERSGKLILEEGTHLIEASCDRSDNSKHSNWNLIGLLTLPKSFKVALFSLIMAAPGDPPLSCLKW